MKKAIEVTRCRDCVYWAMDSNVCNCPNWNGRYQRRAPSTKPDDYCSYALIYEEPKNEQEGE